MTRSKLTTLIATFLGLAFAIPHYAAAEADEKISADDQKPWDVGIDPEVRDEAQALYLRGNEEFTAGRSAEALRLYNDALTRWDHPRLHINAAVSCVELERFLEAGTHVDAARKYRSSLDRADRDKLDAITTQVDASTGFVDVVASLAGTVVTVDGVEVARGPGQGSVRVAPGRHEVVIRGAGLESQSQTVEVAAGERASAVPALFAFDTEWRWAPWKPWTLAGFGAAVAIAGAPLLVSARAKRDERAEFELANCLTPADCEVDSNNEKHITALDESADRRTLLANGAFIAGGIIVAGGVTLAILNRPSRVRRAATEDDLKVSAWIDGETVGGTVALRF